MVKKIVWWALRTAGFRLQSWWERVPREGVGRRRPESCRVVSLSFWSVALVRRWSGRRPEARQSVRQRPELPSHHRDAATVLSRSTPSA